MRLTVWVVQAAKWSTSQVEGGVSGPCTPSKASDAGPVSEGARCGSRNKGRLSTTWQRIKCSLAPKGRGKENTEFLMVIGGTFFKYKRHPKSWSLVCFLKMNKANKTCSTCVLVRQLATWSWTWDLSGLHGRFREQGLSVPEVGLLLRHASWGPYPKLQMQGHTCFFNQKFDSEMVILYMQLWQTMQRGPVCLLPTKVR